MKRSLQRMSVTGLLLFLAMGAFYLSGWSRGIDTAVSETVKYFHQPLVNTFVILLTHLNSPPALLILSLFITVILAIKRAWRLILLFLTGLWGTALATALVKALINRPRPLDRLVEIHSPSFPSWHASTSMALAVLLWVFLSPRWGRRTYWIFLWPLAIGLSRIWLNAHWCSDVLAGWGLGLAVAGTMTALFLPRPYRQGETSR